MKESSFYMWDKDLSKKDFMNLISMIYKNIKEKEVNAHDCLLP
jgi:hypothetical protein